jgi:hypothetical protein
MKTASRIMLALSLVITAAACSHIPYRLNLQPRKPVLLQNYQIECTPVYTTVKANINFHEFATNEDTYPQQIVFNGIPMKNEPLGEPKRPEAGCPSDNEGGIELVLANPQPTPPPKRSDYSIFQQGYRKENLVTITDEDGVQQSYRIYFEPVEFEQPENVTLSRSKDNLIKLKGAGSVKGESPMFGIAPREGDVDKDLLQYDKENRTLLVPAKALKKAKRGNANFWIISGDSGAIKTPGLATGNYYGVVYNDLICVQIVD